MTYEPPDHDESFDRRMDEEEREAAAQICDHCHDFPCRCLSEQEELEYADMDAFLDSLDADPMTAYKQKVEEPEL